MTIFDPAYAFTFGALNLIGSDAEKAANGFRFQVLDDAGDLGNPVAIEQKILTWLQDGAVIALQGYDNREMFLTVMVDATSGTNLALGEVALTNECGKPNLLTYQPADPAAPPSVFSVVMSHLEPATNPAYEREHTSMYGLRIQAEPFARSQTLATVTVPAPSGSQTLTTVDACTSFTNWTGTAPSAVGGTVTNGVSGGTAVFVTNTNNSQGIGHFFDLQLARTSLSASLTTTPYIRVQLDFTLFNAVFLNTSTPFFTLTGNSGTAIVPIAIQYGNVYWLDTTGLGLGTTLTGLRANTSGLYATGPSSSTTMAIADITRSNVIGEPGTNRQLARTIAVAGSARTQATLALADATNALGTTMVYTTPTVAGLVTPNLRTLLASGNSQSADATTISGFTSDLSTLHAFDVPETGLNPGGHVLIARVKNSGSTTRTLTWTARSRQGSTNLGDSQTGSVTVALTTAYSLVVVGTMNLPPKKLGTAGKIRIELTASSTGTTLDEAWLFNLDSGELTIVECGTASPSAGGSANNLWLDAATVGSPSPAVYLGFATDRSDEYHAGSEMTSFGRHQFIPPSMNVFTVTSNATAAAVTLSHYPRYLTRVAS